MLNGLKKLIKIVGISFIAVLLMLLFAPFLFQNQINEIVKTYLNNTINADVDFDDVSLSFINSFPQANVKLDNLKIINHEPFSGETFATIKSISIDISVKELFKKPSDDPIEVNSINVNEALLTLKSDAFGNNNYNITKESRTASEETNGTNSFTFNLEDYAVVNSALSYSDASSGVWIHITELTHTGKGNFSTEFSELDTFSEANISIEIDSTNYLNKIPAKLNALIGMDLNENKYTFKENTGFINQLPIEFNGYLRQMEQGQEIDINFKNTSSSFKDFMALIPKEYSKNLETVKTTGNFKVEGLIKGLYTDSSIPDFDISIISKNASFKYPDLPKGVNDITITATIKNNTGNPDDTFIKLNDLKFKIDEDSFSSSAILRNLSKNIEVDANIDGTLNLANISKAYPIKLKDELSGILKGKLHSVFDLKAIEENDYERIHNNGLVNITDFIFSSNDVVNPINISQANIKFNPEVVQLQSFDAVCGQSDISATGTINNLLGFLLSDKKLQGNFNVYSNTFAVSDFMIAKDTESGVNTSLESLKIPSFLDCVINAEAKSVIYDNLKLKNVKGVLKIKNEQAILENLTSTLFDGNLNLSGIVNTQPKTPVFNMNLDAENFNISQSFNDLHLFQNLAPIAKLINGKLNSALEISGNLSQDYTPDLKSVSGNAFAEILTSKLNSKNEAIFNQLNGALSFIDFDKLELKDVKTNLSFDNGTVNVKPFNLQYQDISIKVNGSHGFDKTMNYKAVFDVPAKYLGTEINNLIKSIDKDAVSNITIPVTASISGSFNSPIVSTDLTSSISKLTEQLIAIQKEKLLNQGKDEIKNILQDILREKSNESDSTSSSNPVKNVLGNLLGRKNKVKDTVN